MHISLCTHLSNKRLDTITNSLSHCITYPLPNRLTNGHTN